VVIAETTPFKAAAIDGYHPEDESKKRFGLDSN